MKVKNDYAVYVIYITIPEKEYNKTIKYMIPSISYFRFSDGKYSGIYAWTKSKKLLNSFINLRGNDKYNVITVDMSDDDYHDFKIKFSDFKLKNYKYYKNMNDKDKSDYNEIVSTYFEYRACSDEIEENLNEFSFNINPEVDYMLFKEKYINYLDMIGYNTRFDLFDSTNSESRFEYADYMASFNLTPMGNPFIVDPSGVYNQILALLYLFKYPLYGCLKEGKTT